MIFAIVLFVGILFYSIFITDKQIVGTYTSNQNKSDTIKILNNNRYISNRFGKGVYKLRYKTLYMKIEFIEDSIGKLNTYIDRKMYFGNLKIHIDDDLEEYYEKTK
jgi:hypothetical protein